VLRLHPGDTLRVGVVNGLPATATVAACSDTAGLALQWRPGLEDQDDDTARRRLSADVPAAPAAATPAAAPAAAAAAASTASSTAVPAAPAAAAAPAAGAHTPPAPVLLLPVPVPMPVPVQIDLLLALPRPKVMTRLWAPLASMGRASQHTSRRDSHCHFVIPLTNQAPPQSRECQP
jgi:hypothetical protein